MPVEFESDKFKDIGSFHQEPKGYIGLLIKMGLAQNSEDASRILLFVSLIMIVVAILVPIIFL